MSEGYVQTIHPVTGKRILEHVLIAEAALGRPLPKAAEVHHVNRIRNDNRNANLVICPDHKYHALLHYRTRIIELGGDPDKHTVCSKCKKLFYAKRTKSGYCDSCRKRYNKTKAQKLARSAYQKAYHKRIKLVKEHVAPEHTEGPKG